MNNIEKVDLVGSDNWQRYVKFPEDRDGILAWYF
jgi:hypothetical protein